MYAFAALVNNTVVTSCCFPLETAGGDDTTVGQSQSNLTLLCDAPRLGRHTRYSTGQLNQEPRDSFSLWALEIPQILLCKLALSKSDNSPDGHAIGFLRKKMDKLAAKWTVVYNYSE